MARRGENGCAYGKVTRTIVEALMKEFDEFKSEIREGLKDLTETNTELYNHLSNRLPPEYVRKVSWLYGILGTIIGAIVGSVVIALLNKSI